MTQNKEVEAVLNSLLFALVRDRKAIREEIELSFKDLAHALEVEDYHKAVESASEIVADCGSIYPLVNLQDSITAVISKDLDTVN